MSEANKTQVGGQHYVTSGLSHWDLIDTFRVGYLEGCASKYITRWEKKGGVQDLKKAAHYLQKLYESRSALSFNDQLSRQPRVPYATIDQFAADNGVGKVETAILNCILNWSSTGTIQLGREMLQKLIQQQEQAGEAEAGAGYGYVNQDR
jgi:hypothetical protein